MLLSYYTNKNHLAYAIKKGQWTVNVLCFILQFQVYFAFIPKNAMNMKIYPPENYYQTFGYFPFFISPVINKSSPDNVYRNKKWQYL